MKRWLCSLGLLLCVPYAQATEAAQEVWDLGAEDDAISGMMQILEQETELATRSRLNADYVPGMVTVLYGKDLEAMGFQLVWEALSLVPGMSTISNSVGEFGVSVRGVGPTAFGSGKLLYLIDGRRTEALLRGTGPASTIRLALVDRIEVIRGPGSSVYGGYAFNGVVNIILKKGNSLSIRSTNQGDHTGEWLMDTGDRGELQANLSLSGRSFKGSGTRSGPDLMYQLGNAANSHAPGLVNDKVRYGTLNMDASWRDYSLHIFYTQSNNGDMFGINNTLSPPGQGGHFDFRDADFYLERKWEMDDQRAWIRLGHKRMNLFEVTPIFASGFTTLATLPVVGPTAISYPDGMVQQIHYTENKDSVEAEWNFNWREHRLLLGSSLTWARVRDPVFWTNYDLATQLPFDVQTFLLTGNQVPVGWQVHTGATNWIKEGIRRTESALYAQDEWRVSDALMITAGLRYDRFSDVQGNLSPRLAAVYSQDDRHIFKAQFATAFRPPTFLEMYVTDSVGFLRGNSALKPERSNNIDLAYIFKTPTLTLRSSLYYSKMKNLIISDLNNQYSNIGRANRKGAEFEYQWAAHRRLRVQGSISYALTRDESTGLPIVGSSRWLGNNMFSADLTSRLQLHVLTQYVGARERQAGDPRPLAPSSLVWNLSLRYEDLFWPGTTASLGVDNLFDRAVFYPSTMTVSPLTGQPIQTYPGDYPQNGRRAWLQLRYSL